MAAKQAKAQIAYRVAGLPPRQAAQGYGKNPNTGAGAGVFSGGQKPTTIGNVTGQYVPGQMQQFGHNVGSPAVQAALTGHAPAAPVSPAAPGGAAPPNPGGEPRDGTYASTIAQNIFTRTQGRAGLERSDKRIGEDRTSALAQVARNYALQRQNINEGSNKEGLFYSGVLGKRLGDASSVNRDQNLSIDRPADRALEDNQTARTDLDTQYGKQDVYDSNVDPRTAYGLSGASAYDQAVGRFAASNPVPPQTSAAVPEGTPGPPNMVMPGMNLGNIRIDQNPGSASVQAAISAYNNAQAAKKKKK